MIHEYAGKRWRECDNCGDLISGQKPTKEDIQKAAGTVGMAHPVYLMCSVCSKYAKENEKKR